MSVRKENGVERLSITVYSKPHCQQCIATYKALDKRGLAYDIVDISQDSEALEMVRSLGYQQAPVIVTENEHWSGFRPDKVNGL